MRINTSYSTIWQISFPIILGMVTQNVMNVIDTAFLGRLNEVALGAGAIGGLYYITILMLGIGFGSGVQIIIGRRNGEKKFNNIGTLIDHSIYALIAMALILFLFLKFITPTVLAYFIKSPSIDKASIEFLNYRSYGIFFAFINVIFSSFYIGIASTKIMSVSTGLMAFINIILDYALIFGNWGFPQMGIGGAALASVIAEGSASLFFIIYTFARIDIKKYSLFKISKFQPVILKNILSISAPLMIQSFVSLGSWFLFFMFIEQLGEHALAVSNIVRSIYMVLMIPIWGFSSATNTLVSNIIGQGKYLKVIPLIKKTTLISTICTYPFIIITFLFSRKIISIYTSNPILINDSISVLYIVLLAMLLFSITMIMFSGVSGSGNTRTSLGIESFTIFVYLMSVYLSSVVFKLKVEFVWISELVYFFIMGLLSYLYLRSGKWKLKKL
ncbi:MAG: MATE family efflux transporter [Bacteroidota bacterium]|nr:MATE family efflux transporter [Bacteroidota bacterium]